MQPRPRNFQSTSVVWGMLLGFIAYSMCNSIIHFFDTVYTTERPPSSQTSSTAEQRGINYDKLGQLNWLRRNNDPASTAPLADISSQFELRGISTSPQQEMAGAYIAENNTQEKFYHIGDALPNNAGTLLETHTDYIVIKSIQGISLLKLQHPPMNSSPQ